MRIKQFIVLPLIIILSSCQKETFPKSTLFLFNTKVNITYYQNVNSDIQNQVKGILSNISALGDYYNPHSGIINLYDFNHSTSELEVSYYLYELLQTAEAYNSLSYLSSYFNVKLGNLKEAWQEALEDNHVLDSQSISNLLDEVSSTSITYKQEDSKFYASKEGNASIDLGGIIKGYALKKVEEIYQNNNITNYSISAGSSSIILGKKNTSSGLFNIGFIDYPKMYLSLKECAISTSSIFSQAKVVDGVTYSHILNPVTGEATSKWDLVTIINNDPCFGDVLSTSFMNMPLEEIQSMEENYSHSFKVLVMSDNKVEYASEGLNIKYR